MTSFLEPLYRIISHRVFKGTPPQDHLGYLLGTCSDAEIIIHPAQRISPVVVLNVPLPSCPKWEWEPPLERMLKSAPEDRLPDKIPMLECWPMIAKMYLCGEGIEIGALNQPLELPPSARQICRSPNCPRAACALSGLLHI